MKFIYNKRVQEQKESKRKGIMMNLLDLPEGCLSHILSLTSPVYILRSSLVCKTFRSLAQSDLVWEKFLPSDSDLPIVQESSDFPSKRDLVLHLCRSFILLHDDKQSFSVDKWSGKKCYMLGARELTIQSSDNPHCWRWKPLDDSRFPEVAELLGVNHLQITGKISTQLLSPNTSYHAYFSFKLGIWSSGFDIFPVMVSVTRVDSTGAYLTRSSHKACRTFYLRPPQRDEIEPTEAYSPTNRDLGDRWLKIDMGRYYNHLDEDVAALEMTLTATNLAFNMSGLIVHGIELLPLH